MTAAAADPKTAERRFLRLDEIHASRANPRKHFDEQKLAELVDSVRKHGVIQDITVRPNATGYEIVAGERRWRAAKEAGLPGLDAKIVKLSDEEALELAVTENLQRADLHAMEEAEGYEALHNRHKHSVEELAAKVGKSIAYVYARLKLCALVKEARQAFLEDRFSPGHAILLARLKPADQKRALEADGALFTMERTLTNFDSKAQKPTSVREFNGWIDKFVRFDVSKDADPMVVPETAAALDEAEDKGTKIIPITHEYHVDPKCKSDGVRTYGPMSWRRADGELDDGEYGEGKKRSKTCEHAVMGIIVVGRGRGEAFKVCVNKEKCDVHWGAEKRRREKLRKQGKVGGHAAPSDRWKQEEAKREAEFAKQKLERERWAKAGPAVLAAIAERVKAMPTRAEGQLAETILDCLDDGRRGFLSGRKRKEPQRLIERGTTAEDLIRHLAFIVLEREVLDEYSAAHRVPKLAKVYNVDAIKILDEVAPVEKPAAPKATTPREYVAAAKKTLKTAKTRRTKAS